MYTQDVLTTMINTVIDANPDTVKEWLLGNQDSAETFIMGKIMITTKGAVDPLTTMAMTKGLLEAIPTTLAYARPRFEKMGGLLGYHVGTFTKLIMDLSAEDLDMIVEGHELKLEWPSAEFDQLTPEQQEASATANLSNVFVVRRVLG
jgi:hypothetical protein